MVLKGAMAVCGLRPALESWERRGNRDVLIIYNEAIRLLHH